MPSQHCGSAPFLPHNYSSDENAPWSIYPVREVIIKNGVTTIGDYSFGKPAKITANTYVGKTGIVNIENKDVKYQVAATDTFINVGNDMKIDLIPKFNNQEEFDRKIGYRQGKYIE